MDEVPSVPISDFENTLSFPGEETSLGQGGFPHIFYDDVTQVFFLFFLIYPPLFGLLNHPSIRAPNHKRLALHTL
jgi:hypothetical protein